MKYPKQYTLRDLERLLELFLNERKGLSSARNFLAWLQKREWKDHKEHCRAYHIDPYTEQPTKKHDGEQIGEH